MEEKMRKTAVEVIYKYLVEGCYLNIELNHVLNQSKLSRQDKDLLTQIVYGTIQNKLFLEYQMAPFRKGKIKKYEQAVLLMSLYQIYFLDRIPSYAIINDAVEIVKQKRGMATSKMINAILRNCIRQGKRDLKDLDKLEKLSIETSTPLWLVKMWNKQLGFEKTKKACFASLEKPTLAARINTLKATKADLLADENWQEGYLSEDALLYKQGNIAHLDEFKEGKVTIQDESSQLVARMLNPQKGSQVLDMCGAPGSKTTHLAAIMENTGHIDVYDLYEHKGKLIQNNLDRLGVTNTTVHVGDSTKLNEIYSKESFDHILLDGPCSGLGVIARKPEIKYQDPQNMDEIIQLQAKLLDVAYLLLKKGGTMTYSTCTVNKKENELQVQKFITAHPDIKKIEEKLILPGEYHSDGFYICKLEKESL